jgi:hypothetical protein
LALKQRGQYWYGSNGDDVWAYFQWWTRQDPATHHRQAICACGSAVFRVDHENDDDGPARTCLACSRHHVMLRANQVFDWDDAEPYECLCEGHEFEVYGITVPYSDDPDSADWFYLGMRCVKCGCLGCYKELHVRASDYREELDLL